MGLLGASFAPTADFELLETVTLTSAQSSVEFTNLATKYASTYQHLQLRVVATFDITNSSLVGRFNSDSGNNYAFHRVFGQGSGVFTNNASSQANMLFHYNQDNNSTNEPAAVVIDLLDPFETTKNKTVRSLGGTSSGSSKNQIGLASGLWMNTASVTSLGVSVAEGFTGWQEGNFRTGSRFSLYGLRS